MTDAKEIRRTPGDECLDFPAVLGRELAEIAELRARRSGEGTEPREPGDGGERGNGVVERAHARRLIGLAFSGGGIRSATFNLGLVIGLARLGLLRRFDYLSLNSGGGYLGGWLTAWIRRRGLDEVEGELSRASVDEPYPVAFLRKFGNYLTPKVGAYSADTWTLIATYIRNLLLNQSILILALAAILLGPRLAYLAADVALRAPAASLVLAVTCLGLTGLMIGVNLSSLAASDGEELARPWFAHMGWIQALVIVPLFLNAWLVALWIWIVEAPPGAASSSAWLTAHWPWLGRLLGGSAQGVGPLFLALALGLLAFTVSAVAWSLNLPRQRRKDPAQRARFHRIWCVSLLVSLPSGAAAGLLLGLLAETVDATGARLGHEASGYLFQVNVWGAPLLVLVLHVFGYLQSGLTGRIFLERYREWWSRLGAWVLIYCVTWVGFFSVAVYGPMLLLSVQSLAAAAGAGWVATTVAGVLIGKRGLPAAHEASRVRRVLLAAAPQVFIVGLLALLALGLHVALRPPPGSMPPGCDWLWPPEGTGVGQILFCETVRMRAASPPERTVVLFLALTAAAAFLSWRIDINQFSMHPFYRNRLIRAFLGASHLDRRPQPFTGFDPNDDLPLAELSTATGYDGPLPIHNAALNLVAGRELAWQERKAASFVFTPLCSGYEVGRSAGATSRLRDQGYRPTSGYRQNGGGLRLGTAMGISGAAVSPSMGGQSKPAVGFLLTVFNVRLGWWLGNPRCDDTWDRLGPSFGLMTLLCELLGLTDESSRYVYLSDGGHFDNLAVYELVRRRCRLIVATDAGADPELDFADLGNLIRKCRVDFGIEIEIDLSELRRAAGTQISPRHCAVGSIRYDRVDPGAEAGTLIYVKASLTGDEPADLQEYAARCSAFPHEPTSDQWFGESQFESYRKLGEHVAEAVFRDPEIERSLR